MTNQHIKFPCPVRRISLAYRRGKWSIEKETRIDSMTLPKSDELPKPKKGRGVTGSWYEAVDKQGRTIYMQMFEDPFIGMEVFERGGKIRRVPDARNEFTMEVLVPDVPELEELHVFSSTIPAEPETEIRGREMETREHGAAQRVASIDLRGGRGGGYGSR